MNEHSDRPEDHENEALLLTQFAVDHASDAVFWIDENARFIYVNEAACRSLEYSREELLRMTVPDTDPTWSIEHWRSTWDELKARASATFETVHQTKSGRVFPVEIKTNFIEYGGKSLDCAYARDISDRKKAEEDLRLIQYALDNMSDAAFLVEPNGHFVSVNRAACDLLGYSEEELLGMSVADINVEIGADIWPAHWEEVREIRTTTLESFLRAKDGRIIPVEIRANFVEFEGKEYHYTFVRDVSERKRSEQALRESSQMLKLVLDTIPAYVFWKDRNGVYLGGNQLFATSAGLASTDDVIGLTDLDMPWRYAEAESYRADDRMVIDTGIPKLNFEETQYIADGRTIWAQTSKIPLRNADGDIIGVLGSSEDITERKRAEEAVQAGEQLLRQFVENTPAAVAMFDRDIRYLLYSKRWMTDYRLGDRDITGLLHYEVFPNIPERWKKDHQDVLAGAVLRCDEDMFERADGTIDWLKWEVRPWTDAEGKIGGIIMLTEVITERRRADEALRSANRTLAALSRVNEILVRVTEESELLRDVCQAIVEVGGYRMVWVGFAEDDSGKTVRPVAHAGYEDGYLDRVEVSWGDNELGQGPAGTAIRTGRLCVVCDVRTDPSYRPWREEALERGYGCSISLPLTTNGKAMGAVSLYRAEPGCLDPAEERLLLQLASDLSYGIMSLRAREERRVAETERRELEQRLDEHKRRFYRETILSVTDGKLDICDAAAVQPYISNAQVKIDVRQPIDVGFARKEVEEFCADQGLVGEPLSAFMVAVGEAVTNALKHGNRGRVYAGRANDEIWVGVKDRGSGIESLILPRAVLRRGFSTKPSLGLGYSIMLDIADRILLKTASYGTTVVLFKSLHEATTVSLDTVPDTWKGIPDAPASSI